MMMTMQGMKNRGYIVKPDGYPKKQERDMPWCIHRLRGIYSPNCMSSADGKLYAFAVSEPYTADRLRAAWWVFTGKAYAFEWPKAGDLEAAIGIPLWDRTKAPKPTGTQAGT